MIDIKPDELVNSIPKHDAANPSTALWKYISAYTSVKSKYLGSIPKYISLSDTPPLNSIIIDSMDNMSLNNTIGECLFKNGSKYSGEFNNGVMDGTGVYEWHNGVRYEGTLVCNRLEGEGKYTWTNGSMYKGEVNEGLRNGYGELRIVDGKLYIGEWLNGKMYGKGLMIFEINSNGDPISYYEGQWKENSREGYGERIYRSGNMYRGQWLRDLPHGRGTMVWKDRGEIYTGNWHEGKQHGVGEMIWDIDIVNNAQFPNRNRYNGAWKHGVRHGMGTFYYATGAVFSGVWVDGRKDGMGTFTSPEGCILRGIFSNDKLISSSVSSTEERPLTPISRLVGDVDTVEKSSRTEIFNQSLFYLVPDGTDRNIELQSVQFTLLRSIDELKWIYHYYSRLGVTVENEDTPSFTRCKLWQLQSDCHLFYKDTYVEIDRQLIRCLPNKHTSDQLYNPSTEFLLREFLQCLVVIGYHLYQSLYKGGPGRLSWCLRYFIEEFLIPRSCHGKGYFYQQSDLFDLSKQYFTPCHILYTSVSKGISNTIMYRQFILMLKDCGVFELLSVETVIGLITSINPLVYQEGCYRMTLEMNFLEFFNILLYCAQLVPVSGDSPLLPILHNTDNNIQQEVSFVEQESPIQQSVESLDQDRLDLKQAHSNQKLVSSQRLCVNQIEPDLSNHNMLNNTGINGSNSQTIEKCTDRATPTLLAESSVIIVKSENALQGLESKSNCDDKSGVPVNYTRTLSSTMSPEKWKSHLKFFFDDLLLPKAVLAMQSDLFT